MTHPAITSPAIVWGCFDPNDWQRSLHGLPAYDALDQAWGKAQSATCPQFSFAWGTNADGSPKYQRFYAPRLDADRAKGRVSMCTWMQHNGVGRTDPVNIQLFNNESVLAGRHDAYITQFAKDAGAWGHPLIIRLNPEMNGWWEGPFSEYDSAGKLANGNTAGSFVRAWRHIVDLARPLAPNIQWYWCANPVGAPNGVQPTSANKLGLFYPGDDYVDFVGCDLYNKAGASNSIWLSFQQCLEGRPGQSWPGNTLQAVLTVSPGKPWIIGEWGCSGKAIAGDTAPGAGDKAAWLTEMLRIIPIRYPFIKALILFNWNDPNGDWAITAPQDIAAFAAGLQNPAYLAAGAFPLDVSLHSYVHADTTDLDAQLASVQASSNALATQVTELSDQLNDLQAELAIADQQARQVEQQLAEVTGAVRTLTRYATDQAA